MDKVILEMLHQSNWIESEYTFRALKDAVKAWEWLNKQKLPLTLAQILRTHEYLLRNLNKDYAGKLRDCDVFIGGERKRFINRNLLCLQLEDFCKDFQRIISHRSKKSVEELEEETRKNHVMFEGAHPFCDGNGRTGRILYNYLRLKVGLPIHVIHGWAQGEDELPEEQRNYYSWFK